MKFGTEIRLFALAALAALFAPSSLAQAQETEAPLRYERVQKKGAVVRNIFDHNGVEVLKPVPGSLVTVWSERAGWNEVEVPGGFPVWVYGRYLQPTDQADVYEVTGNAVNMRPRPESGVNSFPLPQRLHAGDRVRMIELFDASAGLEKTWVRVWSPPGVRAWMHSSESVALGATEDGAALWAVEVAKRPAAPPVRAPKKEQAEREAADGSQGEQAARTKLDEVRALISTQSLEKSPDYGPVREALDQLLAQAPSGAVAAEARTELERVGALEAVARYRSELEAERARVASETEAKRADLMARSSAKDPLGRIFQSRGVLTRRLSQEGTPRYYLRFGKEEAVELVCLSGRYDLDLFAGYEVGVFGETLENVGEGQFEISRLEVLARR